MKKICGETKMKGTNDEIGREKKEGTRSKTRGLKKKIREWK